MNPALPKENEKNIIRKGGVKKFIFFIIIVISGILQVSILNTIRIFYVKPDLILICVVLASLIFEFKWAFFLSIFCGILKDSFSASTFGINTILFPVWCFLIIELAKKISIDFDWIRLAVVFIISVLHNITTGIILIYLGNFIPLGIFCRNVSVGAIYTTLFLPAVLEITNPIFS